jgi:hypothetical protein
MLMERMSCREDGRALGDREVEPVGAGEADRRGDLSRLERFEMEAPLI